MFTANFGLGFHSNDLKIMLTRLFSNIVPDDIEEFEYHENITIWLDSCENTISLRQLLEYYKTFKFNEKNVSEEFRKISGQSLKFPTEENGNLDLEETLKIFCQITNNDDEILDIASLNKNQFLAEVKTIMKKKYPIRTYEFTEEKEVSSDNVKYLLICGNNEKELHISDLFRRKLKILDAMDDLPEFDEASDSAENSLKKYHIKTSVNSMKILMMLCESPRKFWKQFNNKLFNDKFMDHILSDIDYLEAKELKFILESMVCRSLTVDNCNFTYGRNTSYLMQIEMPSIFNVFLKWELFDVLEIVFSRIDETIEYDYESMLKNLKSDKIFRIIGKSKLQLKFSRGRNFEEALYNSVA